METSSVRNNENSAEDNEVVTEQPPAVELDKRKSKWALGLFKKNKKNSRPLVQEAIIETKKRSLWSAVRNKKSKSTKSTEVAVDVGVSPEVEPQAVVPNKPEKSKSKKRRWLARSKVTQDVAKQTEADPPNQEKATKKAWGLSLSHKMDKIEKEPATASSKRKKKGLRFSRHNKGRSKKEEKAVQEVVQEGAVNEQKGERAAVSPDSGYLTPAKKSKSSKLRIRFWSSKGSAHVPRLSPGPSAESKGSGADADVSPAQAETAPRTQRDLTNRKSLVQRIKLWYTGSTPHSKLTSGGAPSDRGSDSGVELVRQRRVRIGEPSPLDHEGAEPFLGSWHALDGSTYHGELVEDLDRRPTPHGLGACVFRNGDEYCGSWSRGKMHGSGVYVFRDKRRYEGEYREGMRDGLGVFTFPDGTRFSGQWQQDGICGLGTQLWAKSARTYCGAWHANLRSGYGRLTCGDGRVVEGMWARGKCEGVGRMVWPGGKEYWGRFESGSRCGHGVMTYGAQDADAQAVAAAKREGRWCGGAVYVGLWKADKKHGLGIYVFTNGDRFRGEFRAGKRDGHGTFESACGWGCYDGQWAADKMHGEGVRTLADGTLQFGPWRRGRFIGYGDDTAQDTHDADAGRTAGHVTNGGRGHAYARSDSGGSIQGAALAPPGHVAGGDRTADADGDAPNYGSVVTSTGPMTPSVMGFLQRVPENDELETASLGRRSAEPHLSGPSILTSPMWPRGAEPFAGGTLTLNSETSPSQPSSFRNLNLHMNIQVLDRDLMSLSASGSLKRFSLPKPGTTPHPILPLGSPTDSALSSPAMTSRQYLTVPLPLGGPSVSPTRATLLTVPEV